MTLSDFSDLARAIADLNDLPLDLAEDIAAQLGDHALINDDGKTTTLTLDNETEPRTILWPIDL